MIKRGSNTGRYNQTEDSAWQVLEHFLGSQKSHPVALQLQKETVTWNKSLPYTDAGQELYNKLNKLYKKRGEEMRTLRKQIEREEMGKRVAIFSREQHQTLEKEYHALEDELRQLRVPILQRLFKSFSIATRYR